MESVAPYGQVFELGEKKIFSHKKLPMFEFAGNVSFLAIDVASIVTERPKLIRRSLTAVMQSLAQKKISVASPLKVSAIYETEEAFRYLQEREERGRCSC
jgi:hypothetical protein